jgi:hypothetical protein
VVVRFSFVAGVAAIALVTCGCDSSSPSANGGSTASAPTTASAEPLVPAVLQGSWRLVPTSAGRVTLVVRETEFSLWGPEHRLTAGLLGDDEVLEFFPTDLTDCESEDLARYRWTLEGDILSFTLMGEDPCRSRKRVLAGSTFERRG